MDIVSGSALRDAGCPAPADTGRTHPTAGMPWFPREVYPGMIETGSNDYPMNECHAVEILPTGNVRGQSAHVWRVWLGQTTGGETGPPRAGSEASPA